MAQAFDNDRWRRETQAHNERCEIDRAKRDVSAGRILRYAKPGKWRVFMEGGSAVLETFGETR